MDPETLILRKVFPDDTDACEKFCSGVNAAFRARASETVPFEPVLPEKLLEELRNGGFLLVLQDCEGKFCAGAGCLRRIVDGYRALYLCHVWVAPDLQHHGLARRLLAEIDSIAAEEEVQLLALNVLNNYPHAVRLYEQAGFLVRSIYANPPGAGYSRNMIKSVPPFRYPSGKRLRILFFYRLLFHLLFHKDGTPNLLARVLAKK